MMQSPRPVVLDTNTVMALWWWRDPSLSALAQALADGRLEPVARADTLDEFAHVLAYRQFGVPAEQQTKLFNRYAALCRPCPPALPETATLPRCRDADDQKFLEVAHAAQAALLISRDKALLRLNRHTRIRPLFRILTPEALCRELSAPPA